MKLPRNFWDWWSASAEGKKVMAEATKAEGAEREAWVQGLAELLEGLKRDLPAPLKALDTAGKKVVKARQALLEAELGMQQARGVVQNVRNRAEHQIAQLEQQLRDGAHPGVHEFLTWLSGVWERERRTWSWSAPKHNGVPMPAAERTEQIRAIREQAEGLLFEPDPEVAEHELERLRGELALPEEVLA